MKRLMRMVAAAMVALGASGVGGIERAAMAQTAPAGNAQPKGEVLPARPGDAAALAAAGGLGASAVIVPQTRMLKDAGVANPFGVPEAATVSPERKAAFARAVDLSPLADLAVYHDGRVKILDTLARETVASLVGRRTYVEVDDAGRRTSYEPMFTLLDMVIDPVYYNDKVLISCGVPLRQAVFEQVFPGEDATAKATRDGWMRVGRLKPVWVESIVLGLMSDGAVGTDAMRRARSEALNGMELFLGCAANLNMVATAEADKPWGHLSGLAPESPAGQALAAMGKAWRAQDASGVNAAARTLAAELPKINAAAYPTTRRAIEHFYNQASPFEYGWILYFLAGLSLLLAMGTQRPWLRRAGVGFLAAAIALHAAGFLARCFIAERYSIQNQFESMTGVSLFAAIVGAGLALCKRQLIFAAAAAGVGFLVLVFATQTGIPGKDINREAAILNTSVLLKYHVTTVLVSYGMISLGFIVSLFYLGTYYFGAGGKLRGGTGGIGGGNGGVGKLAVVGGGETDVAAVSATALGIEKTASVSRARILADLDTAQMTILQLAFWALGVGLLLGAWWADHSWGRWWAFDPKELWALVTWIVYLIVVHVRIAGGVKNRGLVTAWLSLLGFAAMIWCYFGVNLLLPGLHAYA